MNILKKTMLLSLATNLSKIDFSIRPIAMDTLIDFPALRNRFENLADGQSYKTSSALRLTGRLHAAGNPS